MKKQPHHDENATFKKMAAGYAKLKEELRRSEKEKAVLEEALDKQEQEYRILVENSPDFIARFDRDGRFLYCSPLFQEISPLPLGDLYGKTLMDMVPESDAPQIVHDKIMEVFRTGSAVNIDDLFLDPLNHGNASRHHEIRLIPELDGTGGVASVLSVGRDVSLWKETERHLTNLVENFPDMIARFNTEGCCTYVSPNAERITGQPKERFVGKKIDEFLSASVEGNRPLSALIKEVADEGVSKMCEATVELPGGERFFDMRYVPELDPSGKVTSVLGILRDITKRKLAEDILRTTQLKLSQAMELAHIFYWDCDPVKKCFIFDDAFYAFYGTTAEAEGGHLMAMETYFQTFIHPDDLSFVMDMVQPYLRMSDVEFPPHINHRIIRRDGGVRHILTRYRIFRDAEGRPTRLYGANQDISELKQIEEERRNLESRLFQSQKMESLGTLTGGIAHDFNNILTAIMGCAGILQMKLDKEDPLRIFVDQIVSSSEKAAQLTRSLLTFSRQQPVTFFPLAVNDIIKGTGALLKRLVTEDIAVKTILCDVQPIIRADASQIDQVLFNLASNARDAMPKGGTLLIKTEVVELDESFVRSHGYGEPGAYALISFSDTGVGMDEAVQERIFDPFFTTKEMGKGTGLGLSTVYGIVKQHNGYITVDSQPNEGTTFRIYFPLIKQILEKEETSEGPITGGNEVILLAEDSEAVRTLIANLLIQYGYSVIEAADGVEAVDQYKKRGPVDLLILDSVMPKKNGRETYNDINALAPGIRVLFTSGYARDIILNKGIEDGKFNFVSKPIQPIALLRIVREILDGQGRP